MKAALNLDDDALGQVEQYAAVSSVAGGEAVSRVPGQTPNKPIGTRIEHGFEVFDVPGDSPVVTLEHTLRLEDEQ